MSELGLLDADDLVKLLVFVVFFLAPVVKSIADAKRKQREARERLDRPPPTETSEEDAGRAAWEALLRGESVEPAEPAPPPVEPRPRRSFEEVAPERPYTPTLAREGASELSRVPRSVLSSEGASVEGREVLTESAPLTRTRPLTESEPLTAAPALTDTPASEGFALTETPASEGAPISRLVAKGEFQGLGAGTAAAQVTAEPVRARARALAHERADWRRAIVLCEVLGPPVSLRRAHLADAGSER